MTFIEEIEPYIERIKLHQEGGRITNIETLREIRDIHFTHIRSKDFNVPANLGCGNCVKQMINQLVGEIGRATDVWEKIKDSKFNNLYVEGQFEEPKGKKMSFPKQEPKKDKFIYTVDNTTRKELVAICKENGIKTGKVKSSVLVDKINNL